MLNAKQITNLYVLGYVLAEIQAQNNNPDSPYPPFDHWNESFQALDAVLTAHDLPVYGSEYIDEDSGIVTYSDETKAFSDAYLEDTDKRAIVPYPVINKLLNRTVKVNLPVTEQEIRNFLNELVNDNQNNYEQAQEETKG